jgi:hypothetical protein
MKKIVTLSFIILAFVTIVGWAAIPSVTHSRNERISVTAIRVVDADTHQPISGVKLELVCTGGTILSGATFTSDAHGIAQVRHFASTSIIPLNLSKSGYTPKSYVVTESSPEVRLKKL